MTQLNRMYNGEYIWNPWHGCRQCSIGCNHCFVFENDKLFGLNPENIHRSIGQFNLPTLTKRAKKKDIATGRCDVQYLIPPGSTIIVCNSSDFFIEDADKWREQAWDIISERTDCLFIIITKRPENIEERLPNNWDSGYNNVALCVTAENTDEAWNRIPILLGIKAKHLGLWLEPLYEEVDIRPFLSSYIIENVVVGGETFQGLYEDARPLDINWVEKIRDACVEYDVSLNFIKTGSIFIGKNRTKSRVNRKSERALADFQRLNIEINNETNWKLLPHMLLNDKLVEEAFKLNTRLKNEIDY